MLIFSVLELLNHLGINLHYLLSKGLYIQLPKNPNKFLISISDYKISFDLVIISILKIEADLVKIILKEI